MLVCFYIEIKPKDFRRSPPVDDCVVDDYCSQGYRPDTPGHYDWTPSYVYDGGVRPSITDRYYDRRLLERHGYMPDTPKSRPPVHARPKYYDQGMEVPRSGWGPYELGGMSREQEHNIQIQRNSKPPCFNGTNNFGNFLIQFEMVSQMAG